jgi:hypothetical protein
LIDERVGHLPEFGDKVFQGQAYGRSFQVGDEL